MMKTFEFQHHGGITVQLDKEHMTIDVKGKKKLFKKVKPRTKTIPYSEILRIDYKEGGLNVGYLRVITKEIEEYPSSFYVAQIDENSIIFEKEEMDTFNLLMDALQKKLPSVEKVHKKM